MKKIFLMGLAVAGIANWEMSAPAQDAASPPPSAPAQRSAAELEKLAMPIALHPDPLISIILPASVYPVEIVQAARFVKDTNNVAKVDQQPWDDNVKAVAKFPQLVAQLDADLNWTVELGEAFLDQPKELMDMIQSLRAKAQKAGTLQTTPQQIVTVTNVVYVETNVTQIVTVTNQIVQVAPANPEVVYVPSYPTTVYYPPPTYVYDPLAPLISFGVAVGIGAIIANNCDWHGGCVWWGGGYHGDVDIDIDNDINIDRGDRPDRPNQPGDRGNRGQGASQQKWQPDQNRLRTSGSPTASQNREARGWGGGSAQSANRPSVSGGAGARTGQQPSYNFSSPPTAGGQPARPNAGGSGQGAARPSQPTSNWQPQGGNRPSQSAGAGSRPSGGSSVSRPSAQPSTAFSGVNSGSAARSAGNRGAVSRGGGGGGGRGGGGGGRR